MLLLSLYKIFALVIYYILTVRIFIIIANLYYFNLNLFIRRKKVWKKIDLTIFAFFTFTSLIIKLIAKNDFHTVSD